MYKIAMRFIHQKITIQENNTRKCEQLKCFDQISAVGYAQMLCGKHSKQIKTSIYYSADWITAFPQKCVWNSSFSTSSSGVKARLFDIQKKYNVENTNVNVSCTIYSLDKSTIYCDLQLYSFRSFRTNFTLFPSWPLALQEINSSLSFRI